MAAQIAQRFRSSVVVISRQLLGSIGCALPAFRNLPVAYGDSPCPPSPAMLALCVITATDF
jgi:hypothetical protein